MGMLTAKEMVDRTLNALTPGALVITPEAQAREVEAFRRNRAPQAPDQADDLTQTEEREAGRGDLLVTDNSAVIARLQARVDELESLLARIKAEIDEEMGMGEPMQIGSDTYAELEKLNNPITRNRPQ
jgi:hypothetical protein